MHARLVLLYYGQKREKTARTYRNNERMYAGKPLDSPPEEVTRLLQAAGLVSGLTARTQRRKEGGGRDLRTGMAGQRAVQSAGETPVAGNGKLGP